jgi:hypothetical protein
MGTKEVRLDPKLNQALWAQGVKSVPHRIRVKLERVYFDLTLGRVRVLMGILQASVTMRRVLMRSSLSTHHTSLSQ